MLRTPRNYEFDEIQNELSQIEYKIDVNDQMSFQLYTNNGFQLIDMFGENSSSGVQTQRMMMGGGQGTQCVGIIVCSKTDSLVEFPIIGDITSWKNN